MIDKLKNRILQIDKAFKKDIVSAMNASLLKQKYLGKNSSLSKLFLQISTLKSTDKKEFGMLINELRTKIEKEISKLNVKSQNTRSKSKHTSLDVTLPGTKIIFGQLHPLTIVERQINNIFKQMGFSVYSGPHIETDSNVFEKLNLPKDHPARSLQDTLVIKNPEILLRSHTSSVEIRAMENETLPLRVVVPGRVYRYEDISSTNHTAFTQYEGLAVGQGITLSNLFGIFDMFVKTFYGQDTKFRIRAKYYPQVEPGCGLDLQCKFCNGSGCNVCKYRGWQEISGGGMVHPNVLRACNIDPNEYTGIAWGMGFDRIVMQRYGIDDVRKLYDGSLY